MEADSVVLAKPNMVKDEAPMLGSVLAERRTGVSASYLASMMGCE
jgi:hypothetical protein